MTGNRLYLQVTGRDFVDYSPSCWIRPHNHATKRWSKKVRRYLESELKKEITNNKNTIDDE